MNNQNSKFHSLLQMASINVDDEIREGYISGIELDQDINGVDACISIILPTVISIERYNEIINGITKVFKDMGYRDVTVNMTYVNENISEKYLNDYLNVVIERLISTQSRFSLINTFKRIINGNEVTFYVGSNTDAQLLDNYLQSVKKIFSDFNLYVEFRIDVSPFELSLETKTSKKIEQIEKEVINKQNYYDSLTKDYSKREADKVIKKPRLKTPINGKAIPIASLPTSEADLIQQSQINGNSEYVIEGEISSCNIKDITSKDGTRYTIFEAVVADEEASVAVKTFINQRDPRIREFYEQKIIDGIRVKVYGYLAYDKYSRDLVLNIKEIIGLPKEEVKEIVNANLLPRVELHAHTKMSAQDSVMDVKEYVQMASQLGYKALAVTDHYNIHVLPDFYSECKNYNIKPIFGVEGALVDEDKFRIALSDEDIPLSDATFVVYDIETTGLSSNYNEIIEISACKIRNYQIVEEFNEFVKPSVHITDLISSLTSISDDDVKFADPIDKVLPRFKAFFEDCILVAHNATFDCSYIYANLKKLGLYEKNYPTIDTLQLARVCYSNRLKRYDLASLARAFDVDLTKHHRAAYDALATANVFIKMLKDLSEWNIRNYNEINTLINSEEAYKHSHPTHFTILSKNSIGKKNLYEIISDSHTTHFYRQPRILKSFLESHREGLLIGSGCVNGDVFTTAFEKSYDELLEVMKFYDFIEIQPLPLYDVLIEDEENAVFYRKCFQSTIKTIIKAAKELNKIVVATGDVHHLTAEDKKYRDICINSLMIGGGRHPLVDCKFVPSFHFRTTEEMLNDLSFLGEDAKEYVITNSELIADEIEEYELFPKKLFAPADDFLADRGILSVAKETEKMTYARAKELYGEDLPKIIDDRLKKELNSIIGHSFSSIYYISYMLVKHSVDAGYIVGSRGSVGSSLVAYMMKITEVNALPPHYYCPHCHFSVFKLSDDEKIKYPLDELQVPFDKVLQEYETGYDLPEAYCPKCGAKLNRSGVDIPFETFLGFDGTKTPDIDLNFSGDFQPQAHEFCRTIFGVDRAFRAGTIGTIAEKTAIGYVKGYLERTHQQIRQTDIKRLASKIEGVKRSTGQHPGGIVIIPKDKEYSDIIPIQYPADDTTASWRTTHFDYHKFEHNLLKLDILGHDDPTMIRALMNFVEERPDEFPFSSVDEIPLSDVKVLQLFNGLDSLDILTHEPFEQAIATTGIPEFGTTLAKQMLTDIRPTTFAHLLKISGLSHGKGVWQNNSEDFMKGKKEGYSKVPFDELIGCRDDIMVYLMNKGLPASDAFKIMESVRKGKGVDTKMEEEMIQYNIPKWYIESCKLINYMFPKAHATAYVIMALRIGWFKVYRPIYYYAAFFSKRAKEFDVEAMVNGHTLVNVRLKEIKDKKDKQLASNKEEDIFETLLLVSEMLSRGYSFKQIDINKSDATNFIISEDRKSLIIPFSALDSLGESIAKSIVEARDVAAFKSKRDIINRTKLNATQFEKLDSMGVFNDLPEESQMGLFSEEIL